MNPVWRARANSIVGAWDPDYTGAEGKAWEQLWSRKLGDNRFEICCIPFFVYNLALGDEVEAKADGEEYMVQRVVKPSGHCTFRVWLKGVSPPALREILHQLHRRGCLLEFYSKNLLAIDAASDAQVRQLVDFLRHRQEMGQLVYETGLRVPGN